MVKGMAVIACETHDIYHDDDDNDGGSLDGGDCYRERGQT